ncbi:MAG: hypothetical protein FE78DRAFT_75027 [Acidomyces sp. 'richmondensis']|nr:MAG: hypothetical protein FE78DRAFT_75027 [Acidomyces sp. 'richmondensis']
MPPAAFVRPSLEVLEAALAPGRATRPCETHPPWAPLTADGRFVTATMTAAIESRLRESVRPRAASRTAATIHRRFRRHSPEMPCRVT